MQLIFAFSRLRFRFFLLLLPLFLLYSCSEHIPPRILIFSKTAGYRHACIPVATDALRKMCIEHGIAVDTTEESEDFTENNLKRYNAVVFLCTTGDVLTPTQEADFERYIQAGGGFVGIHSATDTEYGWTWFGGLVGAYFNGHPKQQNATLHVEDHDHVSTRHLKGNDWTRFDEWYNFKDLNPKTHVLLTIDEASYEGGTNGKTHPMSWYQEYDGGRAFYTALGHTNESYAEPDFMQHVLGGIKYAIGKQKRLNYSAARTPEQPDPTRFVKTVLANELTEPMELDMFPDGKIIFIERRGNIKLFNPATGLVTIAHRLPVYSEQEDGLMGLAIDPNYEKNNWIYLYYSSVGDQSFNTLSRFVFRGDSLERASEQVILRVAVQRQECCHTGGCIEFDSDGNLFLSTGDNTNPFASEGYSPSDEQPGRSPWDAQKSSANTNDLRGKILRIKPLDDGSYICPTGNLFTQNALTLRWGTPESQQMTSNGRQMGRPEIYVMGCRNPYRISIDSRRKLLFWGEVGPDAGEPDSTRGPAGHDEVNRARASGFFGWPYFVGNNKPYREYDFAGKIPGNPFDPLHPINNSPNNTGSRELPPAQPAFIWYPYGNSPEFPLVGNGGRNAMAGPTYYCDQYPAETRFPDYYNGKLITYDWMRNWMMAVTIDSLGNFSRMEPFADSLRFSRPMDMIVDKKGVIWLLEYGTQWFSSNVDARLSRIEYVRGNRPPIPSLQADKKAGGTPLEVVFTASGTKDYDKDRLKFELDFGDGTGWKTDFMRVPTAHAGFSGSIKPVKKNPLDSIGHVYQNPGTYDAVLKVTDGSGAFQTVKLTINAGNEPPVVYWNFSGKNRSFYQPGQMLNYQLVVEDKEDGSLQSGRIASDAVATTIDYLETGFDITSIAQGHKAAMQQAEYAKGKGLIDRSDCKTCHALDHKINGPSFQDIAERYRGNEFAVRNLSTKVIKGGAGNWGETVMSAHPQLSPEDVGEMVRWILSLGGAAKPKQSLPTKGTYALVAPASGEPGKKSIPGTFIFKAAYRDHGSRTQGALEGGEVLALRPAFQQAEQADSLSKGITNFRPFGGDTVVLKDLKNKSFVMYKHTDMTGIHAIAVGVGLGDGRNKFAGGRIEIHLDKPNGVLLGKADIPSKNTARMEFAEINVPLTHISDGKFHDVYLVFRNDQVASDPITALDWIRFDLMVN